VEGPTPGKEIDLERFPSVLGRDPGADIVIASPTVSRRHARLLMDGERLLLEDLGSSNGTFVGGRRIQGPYELHSGLEVVLGDSVRLRVAIQEEPSAPPTVVRSAGPVETVLDAAIDLLERPSGPAKMTIEVAGGSSQTVTLNKERLTIGRAEDNDIVINSLIVSRHHAILQRTEGGYQFESLPEATNPVLLEGRPVAGPQQLLPDHKLRIGGEDPGVMVTMVYHGPAGDGAAGQAATIDLGEKDHLTLGRDARNDVVLPAPNISRFHAQIERVGQRFRLRDLRSSNGTFVNDQRVDEETWLKPGDSLRIGSFRFVVGEHQLSQFDESGGFRVEGAGLNKWVRKDLNILKNISVVFQPREFVVVVGQSGGGKSTLVDALAGYRPATNGEVKVNGIDVYKNFDAVRNDIGYVPQRDIIHMELTIFEALDYAARLRMPPDTSKEERRERVMRVLEDLDLVHRKDVQISGLSGGQQKRVSIGVELLTKPSLFFLDEPTSGLDPGTETAFMHLMRRLADQGRTIVLVTHATKNVMLADKVIFLARGGYLTWFGPPDEALAYFDQFRTEQERRTSRMEFDKIYAILDDPARGAPDEWAERFQAHPAYKEYILGQLESHQQALATGLMKPPTVEPVQERVRRRASGLRQFLVLSARNLKIIARDRSSLTLMLAAAPLVGSLDFFLALAMGRDLYDYTNGDVSNASVTLFLLTIYSLMVGGLSQMREFVKEGPIYRRERLVNLKILPYVLSKVWVAVLLALYQAAAYSLIRTYAFDMPGGMPEFWMLFVTLALTTLAGMMFGLMVSAVAPNANSAPLLIILIIIPQVVLSGALAPIPSAASAPATTRWAFEAFMGITGVGSDVAADICWELPEELREAMTLEDKQVNGCRCMGTSVFDPERCNFPGVGQRYDPAVDQPEPLEPPPLGDPPSSPDIPPAPEQPADGADTLAMTEYLEALRLYQEETDLIREAYEAEIESHQARAEVYEAEVKAYQEELIEWQTARNSAVGEAEGLIGSIRNEFGWTFVNKDDPAAFWQRIMTTWAAQGAIILVLFALILIFIKRKDRI
jgi:ABC-type multidrug transport system ATPase subunit/pSer/pThr/pTyr-binding forkhead associated (FHA) protein